ncbi:zinc ribbon domain-containing protein [Candidatus Bathyarchaeota archaeon]|nr:MAG: zinc ribbon domain-containing protein [Candidatus Bathyarchaeota archaeon]
MFKGNFEEKKTKRYKLDDGTEFYLIDEVSESELGGGIGTGGAEAKKGTKRDVHAFIVNDPIYGTMPYRVWEQRIEQVVAHSAQVRMGTFEVTPSTAMTVHYSPGSGTNPLIIDNITCGKCGEQIPRGSKFCMKCGNQL